MKIILSRKGFDSGYGGVPSPIFSSGKMVSLPIPSPAGIPADRAKFDGSCLGKIISDLTNGRLTKQTSVHIDPDLQSCMLSRASGWLPSFGQVGTAQSHLANQGIGVGDLFLFFGWFRHAEFANGTWQYVANTPGFHSLFGWLKIGHVIDMERDEPNSEILPWLLDHPHVNHAQRFKGQKNTLYIADKNVLPESGTAGAGIFSRWSSQLKLSAKDRPKSVWNVPTWLEPLEGRKPLSYHASADRWIRQGDQLNLQTVAKGQEFVMDTSHYPEAIEWAAKLIKEHA
jgi:hypothetical protein